MSKTTDYIEPIAIGANREGENNDCTVRALSNAMMVPYDVAHDYMRAHGRINNKGVPVFVVNKAYTDIGIEMVGVFGTTILATSISRLHPEVPVYKGLSLKRALKQFNKGKYIFNMRGHVFAVIDGHVVDKTCLKAELSVGVVYKVE